MKGMQKKKHTATLRIDGYTQEDRRVCADS